MRQYLRDCRKIQGVIFSASPLHDFLQHLERQVFETWAPIRNQHFAHRTGNIDFRRSVAIAPLRKHFLEFTEQLPDARTAEDTDRQPIEQKVVAPQFVQ